MQLKDASGRSSGEVRLDRVQTSARHSFLEYVFGGCEISLLVGIDFTLSNRKPEDPRSLHHRDLSKTPS